MEPFFSDLVFYQEIGDGEPEDIHDPIPPDLYRPELNDSWLYGWVVQHSNSHTITKGRNKSKTALCC